MTISSGVDTVDLEPVLGEIKTNGGNLHGGGSSHVAFSDDHVLAHIDAGSRGRPPHQDFQAFLLTRLFNSYDAINIMSETHLENRRFDYARVSTYGHLDRPASSATLSVPEQSDGRISSGSASACSP